MGAELSGEARETEEEGRGVAREDRAGVQHRGEVLVVPVQYVVNSGSWWDGRLHRSLLANAVSHQ